MGSKKKAKKREKAIRKSVNIRRNNTRKNRFELQVKEGLEWKRVMFFRNREMVDGYVESMEDLRKRDASDIVEGRVIDRKKGKVILIIPEHKQGSKTI